MFDGVEQNQHVTCGNIFDTEIVDRRSVMDHISGSCHVKPHPMTIDSVDNRIVQGADSVDDAEFVSNEQMLFPLHLRGDDSIDGLQLLKRN